MLFHLYAAWICPAAPGAFDLMEHSSSMEEKVLKEHRLLATIPCTIALLLLTGYDLLAAVSPQLIAQSDSAIDSLRKRNCTLTLTSNGQPLAGKEVRIVQLRNDFGFGGTIHTAGLNWDSVSYGDNLFNRYFDWAVPENEMKWPYTDKAPDTVSYKDADVLVDWCNARGIKVRGHNLFWNEDTLWLPKWTYTLGAAEFRAAMERRITGIMTHFKGRVAHWDIINELIHYPQATHGTPEVTLFDSITGDPDIFRWVLKKAREVDSVAKFTINEYAILEDLDATPTTYSIFIDKMNRLLTDSSSFDIVGLEGHFGGSIEQAKYAANLDRVTSAIPRPIWLTEVDFAVAEEIPDRMEELMRTAFAHPNVGGLMLWSWWEAKKWRSEMTSTLADGALGETETGTRWVEMRDKWKTRLAVTTDAAGTSAFRGFQGEYIAVHRADNQYLASRFYLEPGTSDKAVTLALKDTVITDSMYNELIKVPVRRSMGSGLTPTYMYLNGRRITLRDRAAGEGLFLFTYSVTGRQLSKVPLSLHRKSVDLPAAITAGCRIVRIGTSADRISGHLPG